MRGDAQVDCYYINLETAVERREQIEANFSAHAASGWTLTRFAATDAALAADSQVPGTLTSAEKACFLSHRALLRSLQDAVGPVMILEDDAIIGRRVSVHFLLRRMGGAVRRALVHRGNSVPWLDDAAAVAAHRTRRPDPVGAHADEGLQRSDVEAAGDRRHSGEAGKRLTYLGDGGFQT